MAISSIASDRVTGVEKHKAPTSQDSGMFAQLVQAETAALGKGSVQDAFTPTKTSARDSAAWAHAQESHADEDIEAFLAFASLTPEQKIRYLILQEKELTEEELAALPLEERKKIEQEIADAIERKVQEAAGVFAPAGGLSPLEG